MLGRCHGTVLGFEPRLQLKKSKILDVATRSGGRACRISVQSYSITCVRRGTNTMRARKLVRASLRSASSVSWSSFGILTLTSADIGQNAQYDYALERACL